MKTLYLFIKKMAFALAIALIFPLVSIAQSSSNKLDQEMSAISFDHFAFLNTLVSDLLDNAPYTVFLPTEDAFSHLTSEQKTLYFTHPYLALIDLLKGHMISGVLTSGDLVNGAVLTARNGNKLFVSQKGHDWFVNDIKISKVDIHLRHSVIHRVDGILFRPETVYEIIKDSENHNTLEAAIGAARLDGALMGEGPFTVFAPTDEAFAALPAGTVEALLEDPEGDLAQILLYHVVSGTAKSTDLSDGQMVATLQGKEVKVSIMDGKVYINDAMVTVADVMADNGVVHVINAVLLPPTTTVYDIIKDSENLNTLEAAIGAARLDGALMGEGPFTVFAPTDEAFAALPAGTVEALLEDPEGDLAQILLYHVVSGTAKSTDLSDGQMVATLQGKEVKVSIMDGKVYINDAMVTVADVMADNGVVHVINAVLLPPTTTVYDIIKDSENLNTLEAAIGAARLDGALMGEGPFTVFAPTDEAFAALPAGTVEALLEDPEGDLAQILLYHVVSGTAKSTDLSDGQMVATLQGKEVKVSIMDGKVYINDAMVTVADVMADNGVVHVINAVLLPPTTTVYDIIKDSENHNTLEAAIGAARLDGALMGEGPFTVFAPTDEAFAALPAGTVEALLEDPEGDLAQILLYHVVSGTAKSTDLSDGQMVATLQGKEVKVSIMDGKVYINDAMVTVADVMADNGVVHVINAVLLPPTTTVYDIIKDSENHNTLEAAIGAARLDGALMGEGPFTVFAPTDEAFAALPAGTVEALLEDPEGDLAQILLYHVVSGTAKSTDLSDGQMVATLQGKEVKVSIMDGKVYINDAMVTVADVMADNGVVHVINAVLLPPTTTVYDIIKDSENHNTLEAAIGAARLDGALMGEGPFTVFAPTDEAFAALPAGTVEALLEDPEGDLAQILLYHVVSGTAKSTDLSDGQMVATLQGKEVKVSIMDGKVYINDAMVTVADVMADNGVVHVINAVLLPPTTTVYDIIKDSENHNTLEAAIGAARLDGALMGEGPFTVFAPTDEAFAALPAGTVEALLEDPEGDLAQILLYHVVSGTAKSTDLSDGQMVATLQGKEVKVSIMDGKVYINDAMVTVADVMADNGVVHVINAVLLPPTEVSDYIEQNEDLSTLENALKQTGLWEALQEGGPYTIFAPNNDAFMNLEMSANGAVLKSSNDELRNILLYHVVAAKAFSGDLIDGQELTTLEGSKLKVRFEGSDVYINDAMVIGADAGSDNGVVHVINSVLMPGVTTDLGDNDVINMTISPNPARERVILKLDNFEGQTDLMIYDLNGQLVKSVFVESVETTVGLSDLNSGIYFFAIINGGQRIIQKVVVK